MAILRLLLLSDYYKTHVYTLPLKHYSNNQFSIPYLNHYLYIPEHFHDSQYQLKKNSPENYFRASIKLLSDTTERETYIKILTLVDSSRKQEFGRIPGSRGRN